MISLKAWQPGRADFFTVTAPQYGSAFAQADRNGAVRIVDGLGAIYRKIGGQWIHTGQERGDTEEQTSCNIKGSF